MDEFNITQIKHRNLRSQIVAILRAGIVAGEFPVGKIYSALSLAKKMGVSVTPVREAILDIENSGLIEIVRNRGFRVLSMTDSDLDEIRDLRQMLEVPAMSLVIQHASDTELQAVWPILAELESISGQGDVVRFLDLDQAFHMQLMELTGNHRLACLVGNLRDQTRLSAIADLVRQGSVAHTLKEHTAILQALIDRDERCATEAMSHHLVHIRGLWAGKNEAPSAACDL